MKKLVKFVACLPKIVSIREYNSVVTVLSNWRTCAVAEVKVQYQYCLITGAVSTKSREMSSRRRADVDNRKRQGGEHEDVVDFGGEKIKEEMEDGPGQILPSKSKRVVRSRKPVKIEMEPEEVAESNGGDNEEKVKNELTVDEQKRDLEPSPSKKTKTIEAVKVEPPENWKQILDNIKIMRSGRTAMVDSMGCERTADLKQEPQVQRFQTLVSLILSSQTKDQVTYAAVERLKKKKPAGLTVQSMLDIDEGELAEMLKPVGFYRRKATYIKKVAGILRESYSDDIPKTVDDLCSLPGVGPKMAYICMQAAWKENVGIGVDTHVHRISNRLKWTGKKGTNTPEKTREALESWLPREEWQEVNVLLVGFGQEMCLPIGPKCHECLNRNICPSSKAHQKIKKTKGK